MIVMYILSSVYHRWCPFSCLNFLFSIYGATCCLLIVERTVVIHLKIAINRTYRPCAFIRVWWWKNDSYCMVYYSLNTLRTRHNGRHLEAKIFKCILLSEKVRNTMKILLTFVFMGLIDNKLSIIQIIAWQRSGNKPLSEPMMTFFNDAHKFHSGSIAVTSYWAQWRLKSPASRLSTQPFVQAQIKENIKAPRYWHLWA